MEPDGQARAQSLQDFAIFVSSNICANFFEHPKPLKNNRFLALSVPGTVGLLARLCLGPNYFSSQL